MDMILRLKLIEIIITIKVIELIKIKKNRYMCSKVNKNMKSINLKNFGKIMKIQMST